MCGVVGYLNLDDAPAAVRIVERMTRAVAHRGPDGSGTWVDGPLALGHRRLAIIDLTPAGAQPMLSADGRFVISYNGEVYNFRELRAELQARGHSFRSSSDTEVIVEAFAQWGVAAVERFNGMFALAVWDRVERRLLLMRDRFGIKPMYFARVGKTLLFGSEVKALLAHGALEPALDFEALGEYLTFQNFFTSRTLFKNISLLPAGTVMETAIDGGTQTRRYWDFRFSDDLDAPSAELIDSLDHALVKAVNRQLISDVPSRLLPVRRHGYRHYHRNRRRADTQLVLVHGRLRSHVGLGLRAWLR